MNAARNKLKNKTGASLGEMMVTVLILVLASGILVTGITLAANNFEKTFANSQAQVLESTLRAAIENELRYTTHIWVDKSFEDDADDGTKNVGFAGFFSKNFADDYDKMSEFNVIDVDGNPQNHGMIAVGNKPVVSEKSYSHGLKACFSVDNVVLTKEGSNVKVSKLTCSLEIVNSKGKTLAESTFAVMPINNVRVDVYSGS